MRKLLSLACLLISPLLAETVENLEFQFPPSNYEWRLLTDVDQDLFFEEIDEEDEDFEMTVKIYTHREGDALELFFASYNNEPADENPMDEQYLLDQIYKIFPNHRFQIQKTGSEELREWEFTDGVQDILHGYSRTIKTADGIYGLGYVTTASKSEFNRYLWTAMLNQAHLLD